MAKMQASAKRNKSPVPSVEKALDVLELLAGSEDGMTMNEMVEALDRTMGEIYRIVVYMTGRGYLAQNADTNRYTLTLKLFELSHRHNPTERLIACAQPILERIAARTEQSCHIGVLNRTNVLVLSSVQSPRPAGYAVRTGAMFAVDRTSSGHVILAFSSQDTQRRYLARKPAEQRRGLSARIARIRKRGFEDTSSTMIKGVRNLCAPVFDSRGIAAAITSGFISQFDQVATAEETLEVLRTSALELSQALGFRLSDSPFRPTLDPHHQAEEPA